MLTKAEIYYNTIQITSNTCLNKKKKTSIIITELAHLISMTIGLTISASCLDNSIARRSCSSSSSSSLDEKKKWNMHVQIMKIHEHTFKQTISRCYEGTNKRNLRDRAIPCFSWFASPIEYIHSISILWCYKSYNKPLAQSIMRRTALQACYFVFQVSTSYWVQNRLIKTTQQRKTKMKPNVAKS